MAVPTKNAVLLGAVRTLFGFGVAHDLSDRQLLERFLDADRAAAEAAFTILVERHGPMVLRVCRQALDRSHDAEDAFQATFLVFLRRARSIRTRESVASWLFGVALRVARRARHAAMVRRIHEQRAGELLTAGATAAEGDSANVAALHEEIARLPDRYREPIVLCHLGGLSTAAAAQRLGCPPGTVLSRLARGRDRLRRRLVERGLALPAGLLAASVMPPETAAALPAALVTVTAHVAGRALAGRAAWAAAESLSVAALTQATLRTMLMTRLTLAATVVATAAVVATLTVGFIRPTLGAGAPAAMIAEGSQPPEPVVDQDATARRDLSLLQGTWYRVSSEVEGKNFSLELNGQPIPPKDPALMIVFQGDGWYGMGSDGKTLVQGHKVRLDTTRRPKAIDLYNLGPDRNPGGRAWIQGIYKLEGDMLTLCLNFGGVDRPTEFATHAGPSSSVLDVYKRDRPLDEMPGPIEQKLMRSRDLEDALYKILKRDHRLDDPRWPFVIRVRDVQERSLIDATLEHRTKGKKNEFDTVVHAKRGVLRFDLDANVVRAFLKEVEIQHVGRDGGAVWIENHVLVIPVPAGNPLMAESSTPGLAAARPNGRIVMMDSDQALSLAYSAAGKTLATAGFDGAVHLWDMVQAKEVARLKEEKSTIRSLSFAPDGKTVACANDAGFVRIWDTTTGMLERTLPGLSDSMRQAARSIMLDAIAFAPDGHRLAVSGFGPIDAEPMDRIYELRVFDLQAGQPRWSHIGRGEQACSLAFAPDGEILARAGWKTVTLWNARDGEPIRTLYPTKGTIFALAFTPDGRTLVGGGNVPTQDGNHQAGLVTLWNVTTGQIIRALEGHRGGVHAVAIAPDGKTVASGGEGPTRDFPGVTKVTGEVRLWDIATGRLLWTVEGEGGVVRGLAFAPDGETIVFCDDDAVAVIDIETGKLKHILRKTTRTPRRY